MIMALGLWSSKPASKGAGQRRSNATRHTPNPALSIYFASLAAVFRVQTHHSAAERQAWRGRL